MSVHRDFGAFYDAAAAPIRTCRSCDNTASKALFLSRFAFPCIAAFATKSAGRSRNAQASGPIIAIGSGPYRKTLFDILKAVTSSDSSCMDIGNLQPMAPSYNVGSIVDVLARMGPNQNQPGGRARVSEAKDDKYTVTYVLDNRVERDLHATGLYDRNSYHWL